MLVSALVIPFGIVFVTLYVAQKRKGWHQTLLAKIQVRLVKDGMSCYVARLFARLTLLSVVC